MSNEIILTDKQLEMAAKHWLSRKTVIEEHEPPFYCAANIDQVPDDAKGKEWEFGVNGMFWFKGVLKRIDTGVFNPFITIGGAHIFMRPIQPKPVKRMSVDEACNELSKTKPFYWEKHTKHFNLLINPGFGYTKYGAEQRLSEKLGCEVMIDE